MHAASPTGTGAWAGRFVRFWMTMGGHDMVLVHGTPDDAVAARFTLVLKRFGSVRTKTMKAFPEAAHRGIVAPLGHWRCTPASRTWATGRPPGLGGTPPGPKRAGATSLRLSSLARGSWRCSRPACAGASTAA